MPSALFLSSYGLFKSALGAFLETSEDARLKPNEHDVIDAYQSVTNGLSQQDKKQFVKFAYWLLELPGKHHDAATTRRLAEWRLNYAVVASSENLIADGSIILIDEFLRRTGLDQATFLEKLKHGRVFKMPSRMEFVRGKTYVPAFFADAKFDLRTLETASVMLRKCSGIEKFRFFTTPLEVLGNQTPLDIIAAEGGERVLAEVKTFRRELSSIKAYRKLHQ